MSEEIPNDHLKTIVKGTGIVFFGIVMSKVFSYLLRIFIARYYGPNDYGIFNLALAVLGIFMIFALLGQQSGVIRFTAFYRAKKDEPRVRGVITSSIIMVMLLSIAMALVMYFSSAYIVTNFFREPTLVPLLMVMSLSIPFSAVFTLVTSVYIGFKRIRYQVFTDYIFQNFAKLAFVIAFGMMGLGITGIGWAWVFGSILTLMLALYYLEKMFPVIKRKAASVSMKKEMFVYSLPLLLTASISYGILWVDTLMIGYFMNATDVGIYNAAMPTAQLLIIFPNALAMLFLPIITELLAKKDTGGMKKIYKTVTRWTFYLNFPVFLLLVLFPGPIINMFFGPEYISGYMALIILSFGMMFRKVIPSSKLMEMLKKTNFILYITIVDICVDVALNLLLIPIYGITGAAIATTTTYIISFLLLLYFSYRFSGIEPFSFNILKAVAAGLISAAVIYTINLFVFAETSMLTLVFLFVSFLAIYGMLLLVLRSFDATDIEIMKSIENRSGLKIGFLRKLAKRFV